MTRPIIAYYVLNEPTIADVEYDARMKRLRELEEANKAHHARQPDPASGRQAAEGFADYLHKRPMMSLDNSYDIDELRGGPQMRTLAEGRASIM
jgi:DNA ligase (NAD+)